MRIHYICNENGDVESISPHGRVVAVRVSGFTVHVSEDQVLVTSGGEEVGKILLTHDSPAGDDDSCLT